MPIINFTNFYEQHSKKPRPLKKGKKKRKSRKKWLLRRDRKNLRRRMKKKKVGCYSSGGKKRFDLNDHTKDSLSISSDKKIVIDLPEQLDFDNNYESTVSHFTLLHKAVKERKQIRCLRFDKIKYISPSAALVLASEVDRWDQMVGIRLKADIDSWDVNIKRLLCEMGYFELLHKPKPVIPLQGGKTIFLPFKKGKTDDRNSGALAKRLRIDIEGEVGERIKKQSLFEGISEAITNVGQHAYRTSDNYSLKQWWLSASYNSEDKRLFVTFFDQGEGIPKTLPRSYFFMIIKDSFNLLSDSGKIKAAMETGRTSTGCPERGKGLMNLVEFAKSYKEGQLSIYSLRGMYRQKFVITDGKLVVNTVLLDHKYSIGGTLIEWEVRL